MSLISTNQTIHHPQIGDFYWMTVSVIFLIEFIHTVAVHFRYARYMSRLANEFLCRNPILLSPEPARTTRPYWYTPQRTIAAPLWNSVNRPRLVSAARWDDVIGVLSRRTRGLPCDNLVFADEANFLLHRTAESWHQRLAVYGLYRRQTDFPKAIETRNKNMLAMRLNWGKTFSCFLTLSLAAQCIVIGPVCVFVCLQRAGGSGGVRTLL